MRKKQNEPTRETESFLVAWLLMAVVHFLVCEFVEFAGFATEALTQINSFGDMQSALSGADIPPKGNVRSWPTIIQVVTPWFTMLWDGFLFLLSLPYLCFIRETAFHTGNAASSVIPFQELCLNSALAGLLILTLGQGFTHPLPATNRWRRFFRSEIDISHESLPYPLQRLKIVRAALFLKSAETNPTHRFIAISSTHFVFTMISRWLEIGDNLEGSPGMGSMLARLLRFPLQPFIISDMNQTLNSPSIPDFGSLLLVLNSVFFALVVTLFFRLLRRDGPPEPPSRSSR